MREACGGRAKLLNEVRLTCKRSGTPNRRLIGEIQLDYHSFSQKRYNNNVTVLKSLGFFLCLEWNPSKSGNTAT